MFLAVMSDWAQVFCIAFILTEIFLHGFLYHFVKSVSGWKQILFGLFISPE